MNKQPHIVVIDGQNFLYRARSGWQLGPAPVIFNFMRNFRAIVELLKPTRLYFVLEGHPQQRIDALPEYKGNRVLQEGTEEYENRQKFFDQINEMMPLLKENFPISVVRHPRFECDDTIYNLIKRSSTAVPWTVVSNDSDFTQLLNEFQHIKIYDPMKKKYVETPEFDYVSWKALRGDGSDNIPGIPGVGDKTAERYLEDPDGLQQLLSKSDNARIFLRNLELIKFITWTEEDASEMESSSPTHDWGPVRKLFERYEFKSLLQDKTWEKFVATFDQLW
jgi:5'-3' exonuclease